MRMIYKATGTGVNIGDTVTDSDGRKLVISGLGRPGSPASSGRLYVKRDKFEQALHAQGFFPHVFGCEWIEREDR